MTNSTRKWIRGGIEVLIHGGTSAVISSLTAAGVAPNVFPPMSANFFKMMGSGFLFNGGLRLAQWWNNNPLPPETDTAAPFYQASTISLNPLAKVQGAPAADISPPAPQTNNIENRTP
jgi:hypothetical protein